MIDTPILAPIVEKAINENFWPTFIPFLEYAIKEPILPFFANKIIQVIGALFLGTTAMEWILNISDFISNIHKVITSHA